MVDNIFKYKQENGIWQENRQLGLKGEALLMEYLKKHGAELVDLNFHAPCDDCNKIQDWKSFNKLPDGLAKMDNDVFFFEVKTKKFPFFKVNERDYKEYQKFLPILPVRLYFIILENEVLSKLFIHNVSPVEIPVSGKAWDGNDLVDVSSDLWEII